MHIPLCNVTRNYSCNELDGEHLTSTPRGFSALCEFFSFNSTSHETPRIKDTHITHAPRTHDGQATDKPQIHKCTNSQIHMTYAPGTYHAHTTDKPHGHNHTNTPHTHVHTGNAPHPRNRPTTNTKIKTSSLKFFASFLNFKDSENALQVTSHCDRRREAYGTEVARDPGASYVITRF